MSQAKPIIGFKGVKSSGNPLAFGPGALARSINCMLTTANVVQPRRGQKLDGTRYIDNDAADANDNRASELFQWGEHLAVHYEGDAGGKLSILQDFLSGSTATLVGSVERPYPDELRMKFAEMVRSLYFTTDVGVKVLDTPASTPRIAGIPAPKDFYVIETAGFGTRLYGNPDDTGSFLDEDTAVGYKGTIGLKDSNGVIFESEPNGRILVRNPADITVGVAELVRQSNSVTATLSAAGHGFRVGDSVDLVLTGADIGNFDPTANIVTSVSEFSISWAETAGDYDNVEAVTITSGRKRVQAQFGLPSGLSTSYFYRLYRTVASEGANIDPGNEHYLCVERRLTATDISNGFVTFVDTTPDAFLGEDLYTNPNGGDGPLSANTRPPHAADICSFDGRMFYFRTRDRHRLFLRLLGVGSPDGMQAGDLVAINNRVWVAGTDFVLHSEHTPSRNIADTIAALAYAYGADVATMRVLEDGDSPTGQLLVEAAELDDSPMHAAGSRASSWQDPMPAPVLVTEASTSRTGSTVTVTTGSAHGFVPGQQVRLAYQVSDVPDPDFPAGIKTIVLTPTGTTFTYTEAGAAVTMDAVDAYVYALTYESDNSEKAVRFSKQGEPEACPLAYNIDDRLPPGADVLRGKTSPQNDRLYLFVSGGDIFEVSGTAPYTVRRFDDTAELIAGDTLKGHAGRLHALTTQGVVAIDDAGVAVVGGDIEEDIRKLLSMMAIQDVPLAGLFALSYESDRQYQLWLPMFDELELADGGVVQQCFLLNSLVGQWMGPWLGQRTCGIVFRGGGGDGLMVLGDGEHNQLRVERKSRTFADFADEDSTLDVGAGGITLAGVVDLDTAPTGFGAGDICEAPTGSFDFYRVTAVGVDSITLAPKGEAGTQLPVLEETDTVTVVKRFRATVKWTPDSGGQPGLGKHQQQVQLHFKEYLAHELTATWSNEKTDTTDDVVIGNSHYEPGEPIARLLIKRAKTPKSGARATTPSVEISLNEALSYFHLLGYSLSTVETADREGQ